MTTISPWINFNGNAEEAFNFYKSVFGGEFAKVVRFKDIQDLLKRFPPKHKKIFGHHSTVEFEPENLDSIEIEKEYSIKIIGRAYDEFGDDLLVENMKSKNKYPHITLSRGEHAPPLYSKILFEKAIASKNIEYFSNEKVEVIEGYSDGKNDIIKQD